MTSRRTLLALAVAIPWGTLASSSASAESPKAVRPMQGPHHGMMGNWGGGPGYGMMGPGMMMGPDIMGGWGVGGPWIADLGLSDTQKKKVDALAAEAQEASRADWQAMNEAHLRMQAALNGERTDRGTAMAAYRQMQEAMAHHLERNLDLREKLDAVLTDRQRDILQERRRQGCGMGMGPGMRPGGGIGR